MPHAMYSTCKHSLRYEQCRDAQAQLSLQLIKKEQQSEGKIPRVQGPAFSLTIVGVLLDGTNNSAARSKPTYPPTIAAQCHLSFGDAIVKKSWSSASWRRFFSGAWRFLASGRRLFFRCPERNRLFLGKAHLRMPRQRSWGRGEIHETKTTLRSAAESYSDVAIGIPAPPSSEMSEMKQTQGLPPFHTSTV